MGQNSPVLAAGLAATAVLLGLTMAGVDAPRSAEPAAKPAPAAAPRAAALVARPVRATVASNPVDGSVAVRAAVATHAAGTNGCAAGLIALTFDDGPDPAVTAKLVRTLVRLKVPATFFMIGSRVDAHPELARLVQSSGFTIGNHTWDHPQLTHLSKVAIRDQLRATSSAFKRHFITPTHLMRPPYGDIDDRVRNVIHELGMIPVLWTIDSRDWAGGDRVAIAHRILRAVRPHATNLVLQHDGVENSPASLAAVPIVVRRARERGYCFTHLNEAGGVGGSTAPSAAARIVPARLVTRSPSTTTARVAARPVTRELTVKPSTVRLLFASRAAMRMPRSAYLHLLTIKLPLRQY